MNMWTKIKICGIIQIRGGVFMSDKAKTVCFTGHREIKDIDEVKKRLLILLEKLIINGYYSFITGGALGFDTIAAQVVLELKKKYPQISLTIALPFLNSFEYEKGWTSKDIETYTFLKNNADEVVILNKSYKRGCYYERNRYMVDNLSVCIAYQRRKSGGTAYTVEYAVTNKIEVINMAK